MKLSLKQKAGLVIVFPVILVIWMVGWSLYWIGDAQGKRKKNIVWRLRE